VYNHIIAKHKGVTTMTDKQKANKEARSDRLHNLYRGSNTTWSFHSEYGRVQKRFGITLRIYVSSGRGAYGYQFGAICFGPGESGISSPTNGCGYDKISTAAAMAVADYLSNNGQHEKAKVALSQQGAGNVEVIYELAAGKKPNYHAHA
jgi:hypothetical protein